MSGAKWQLGSWICFVSLMEWKIIIKSINSTKDKVRNKINMDEKVKSATSFWCQVAAWVMWVTPLFGVSLIVANYAPWVLNYAPRVINYTLRAINYVHRDINYASRDINYAPRVNSYTPREYYRTTSLIMTVIWW